ncbi:MAG: glycosyltransferase [Firmicutes bacterium]|nr:glycosyltransferase [Bacillota bacterium]
MRIAIIASGYYPVVDGVSVLLEQRIKYLSELGHEVLLLCPDYSGMAIYPNWRDYTGEIFPRVTVVPVPSKRFFEEFDRTMRPKGYKFINKELEKFKPDVIHVDEPEKIWMGMFRRVAIRYAREHNIPCVAMYHTNYLEYGDDYVAFLPTPIRYLVYFLFKKLLAFVYHAYNVTLVSNRVTEEKIQKWGIRNNLYEHLTGIYTAKFDQIHKHKHFFEREYGLKELDGKIKLVFCGRLTPDKGWDFTMKAFPMLLKRVDKNKVAILVLGDGPLRQDIEKSLKKTANNLHLFGRIPNHKVYQILKHCDIFVTNSQKENSPVSTLEGAAAGLPIIAPRAGGVIEQIIDGKNGFLYDPTSYEDFCRKAQLLIEDEHLRKIMGEYAALNAKQYDHDFTCSNLINIWTQYMNPEFRRHSFQYNKVGARSESPTS